MCHYAGWESANIESCHHLLEKNVYTLLSQTHSQNVLFQKKGSHIIGTQTAANIHSAPLPLFTHYKGMLTHYNQWLELLACCFYHI